MRPPAAPHGQDIDRYCSEAIGDWEAETIWLPGHVRDRNERRRQIQRSDLAEGLTFLGACRAAQAHQFVSMVLCLDRERCPLGQTDGHGWDELWDDWGWHSITDDQALELAEADAVVMPWTRIELPDGWDDWD